MAISPIGVSFKSNYNVGFTSKKDNRGSHSTTPVKAVPLAVLLAMSPLNVQKAFSLDPNYPEVEQIMGVNNIEQTGRVPLPKNCEILKTVTVGAYDKVHAEFNLIDLDNDKSDFEMLEITDFSSGEDVASRGILKAVALRDRNNEKSVTLYGIRLSNDDRKDYRPQQRIFQVTLTSELMYNTLKSLVQMRENHGSFINIRPTDDYRKFYYDDLNEYKSIIGIR